MSIQIKTLFVCFQLQVTPVDNGSLDYLATELKSLNLLDETIRTIVLETKYLVTHQVVPNFWKHFETSKQMNDVDQKSYGFFKFQQSVGSLYKDYTVLQSMMGKIILLQNAANYQSQDLVNVSSFFDYFRNALLSQLPHNFHLIVHAFYHISFKVFVSTHETEDDDDMMDQEECKGCGFTADKCNCQELVNAFTQTNTHLSEMGLLDR